ncbi:hypothetical protein [Variovorax sp. RA8]|uniref:hypothetical protein n=1 Tax=Variovorax sp. (strain JCM 16519 / RA8) TaxID=662548 RepID=UPI0013A56E38|nr:hypothetical protein [Variovorax sp. RA8]
MADLGVEAARVLENPAFNEAMRLMRENVVERWKDCPVRDREGQVLLLQAARIADNVESTLRGLLEAGKLATAKIDIDSARNESGVRRALRKVI